MKKCPFCAEDIQEEAIKCKHCGEFLTDIDRNEKLPWYFRGSMIVIAILSVGPLALPMVWFHPKYSKTKKIVISLIVVVLTYYLYKGFTASMNTMNQYMNLM